MNPYNIQSILEDSELFEGLNKEDIQEIANVCRVKQFKPGEEVFQQGDFGEHIYSIADGRVSLERCVDLGQRKGKAVIDVLGKGRALGCWSTLLDKPHNLMASAICLKPTTAVVITGADLREMMIRNKDLGFHILERICFLLRERMQAAYGAMEKI